jgi:hypothetical protein
MPTHDLLMAVLVLAIIVFAIARQTLPRRVSRIQFLIVPIIALYEAYHSLPHVTIPLRDGLECVFVLITALIAGSIQALTVRVYYKESVLYTQGGWMTIIAWLGFAVARTLIGIVFQGADYFSSYGSHSWIIWTGVAVTFGTRSAILYLRHPEIRHALTKEQVDRRTRRAG